MSVTCMLWSYEFGLTLEERSPTCFTRDKSRCQQPAAPRFVRETDLFRGPVMFDETWFVLRNTDLCARSDIVGVKA